MDSRPFGDTGLTVSSVGLGLAALGRPGYLNLGHGKDLAGGRSVEALKQHAHRMLDAAWQAGIRYVDAARSYGLAEAFLASWLSAPGNWRPRRSPWAPSGVIAIPPTGELTQRHTR